MGDVMSKMFTYAGMSTALLAVIAIHLFLWWQVIRAIVIRTRRTYEAVVIQRALNEYFALRALSRHEHSDMTIRDEAADARVKPRRETASD